MGKELLVSRTSGKTQYQLYRARMMYPATYADGKGTVVQQNVSINGYGIVVIVFIGQEMLHYDTGPLSALGYQANWLFHKLFRLGLHDLDQIRKVIWKEHESWCWNQYGNPFSKTANQKLKKRIRQLLH